MMRWLGAAACLVGPVVALAQAQAQEPPPPEGLPPAPPDLPPPLPQELARVPGDFHQALHLGVSVGLEVARDLGPAYAAGLGVHLGWELYWPSFAVELAIEGEAFGDASSEHGFLEAHPILFLKVPYKEGVWELFGGYGASWSSMHLGWLDSDTIVHVAAIGLEDRTSRLYSRLFLRGYLPHGGGASGVTVIAGMTVGWFGVD